MRKRNEAPCRQFLVALCTHAHKAQQKDCKLNGTLVDMHGHVCMYFVHINDKCTYINKYV